MNMQGSEHVVFDLCSDYVVYRNNMNIMISFRNIYEVELSIKPTWHKLHYIRWN